MNIPIFQNTFSALPITNPFKRVMLRSLQWVTGQWSSSTPSMWPPGWEMLGPCSACCLHKPIQTAELPKDRHHNMSYEILTLTTVTLATFEMFQSIVSIVKHF